MNKRPEELPKKAYPCPICGRMLRNPVIRHFSPPNNEPSILKWTKTCEYCAHEIVIFWDESEYGIFTLWSVMCTKRVEVRLTPKDNRQKLLKLGLIRKLRI